MIDEGDHEAVFLAQLGSLDAGHVWLLAAMRLGPNRQRQPLRSGDPAIRSFAERAAQAAIAVSLSHVFDLVPEHSLPHGPAADAARDIAIAMVDPTVDPIRRNELMTAWDRVLAG